jgi:hypothetical protein
MVNGQRAASTWFWAPGSPARSMTEVLGRRGASPGAIAFPYLRVMFGRWD